MYDIAVSSIADAFEDFVAHRDTSLTIRESSMQPAPNPMAKSHSCQFCQSTEKKVRMGVSMMSNCNSTVCLSNHCIDVALIALLADQSSININRVKGRQAVRSAAYTSTALPAAIPPQTRCTGTWHCSTAHQRDCTHP